jgi:hypothetical protein
MTEFERVVVLATTLFYGLVPLSGVLAVFDPLRPPIPPLVGPIPAACVGVLLILTATICGIGVVRRPPARPLLLAQMGAPAAIVLASIFGFDPLLGLGLGLLVGAAATVGCATVSFGVLPGAARMIVTGFLASSIAVSLLALVMLALHRPAAVYAYNNGRAIGTFLNPNEAAAYLMVALAIAGGVLVVARGTMLRSLAIIACIVDGATFLATYSRWGLVAFAVGLIFVGVFSRNRRLGIGATLVVVAAFCAVMLAPKLGYEHHNPRDDASRVVAWTTGVRTFLNFPLTGVGPLAFARTYDVFRPPEAPGNTAPVAFDPHSLPLAYLDGSGIVGLFCLIAGYAIYGRELLHRLHRASEVRRRQALATVAGLLALNVFVLINTISLYFALFAEMNALALVLADVELDVEAR